MARNLSRFKPGVPRRTHLLLAASLWTVVGIYLMVRGVNRLVETELLMLFVPAMLTGTLKSHLVLDKSAQKSIQRILLLKDGTCLGAVYSWKTWLIVVGMMLMGFVLRQSPIPGGILGFVYITVGWALFWSSRHGWLSYYRKYDKNI